MTPKPKENKRKPRNKDADHDNAGIAKKQKTEIDASTPDNGTPTTARDATNPVVTPAPATPTTAVVSPAPATAPVVAPTPATHMTALDSTLPTTTAAPIELATPTATADTESVVDDGESVDTEIRLAGADLPRPTLCRYDPADGPAYYPGHPDPLPQTTRPYEISGGKWGTSAQA